MILTFWKQGWKQGLAILKPVFANTAAQMILVVLLALVLAQVISFLILGNAFRTLFFDINEKSQLRQIDSLVELLEISDPESYPAILAASSSQSAWFTVNDYSKIEQNRMKPPEQRLMGQLLDYLGDEYQGRIRIIVNRRPHPRHDHKKYEECEGEACQNHFHHDDKKMRQFGPGGNSRRMTREGWLPPKIIRLKVSVQLLNGHWLNLKARAPAAPPLAPRHTFLSLALASVFVLLTLGFMVRRITRPLRMLSRASVKLGMGEQVQPVPEKGPEDLRETIRAFNQMNNRLQRFVSDRTRMLAALSHDLRTPITSMRLRVELMPESPDRDQLLATLEEMQQMSEATLSFIRHAADNEQTRQVDLNAMLGSLCDDLADLGQDVDFKEGKATIIRCRPVSLKRAQRNLIENAVKYGHQARVSVEHITDGLGQQLAVIRIRDSGPGIPEDKMEQVFEPFARLEESRNRDTGGMGLGMAIARNIVRNHGGDVELVNQEQGLEVRVMMPWR